MRRRIFWAIMSVTALVLVLVTTASALSTRSTQRSRVFEQLSTTTEVIGNGLADRPIVQDVVAATSEQRVQQLLDQSDRRSTLDDGTVVRLGVLTDTYFVLAADAQLLSFDPQPLRNGEVIMLDQSTDAGQVVAVVRPVVIADTGTSLVVVAARELPRVSIGELMRTLFIPVLLTAIVAAIVARLAATSIVRRLDSLRSAAARVRDGDWSARASAAGADELSDVAETFNGMAAFLGEASQRERSFLMSVSHDLRTPLTTIAGYAELLAQDPDHETARVGGVLDREANRLRRLIDDVVLLAQLRARQFSVAPEEVHLGPHVEGIIDGFAVRAGAARVHISTAVQGDVPVVTDPVRVDQIVVNLVDNALRHTPEQGEVRVEVAASPDGATVTVQDSGPGVPADELEKLFERFYVARQHERPEGSGLGLSIVRELVDMLGGSVRAFLPASGGLAIEVRFTNLAASP